MVGSVIYILPTWFLSPRQSTTTHAAPGDTTEIGEPKPGPYGRLAARKMKDQELPQSQRNAEEVKKPGVLFSFIEMLKGPIGVFLGGIGLLAVVVTTVQNMDMSNQQ